MTTLSMKIVYILFYAAVNLIIYFKLNEPDRISKKQLMIFVFIALIFVLLHIGIIQSPLLIPAKDFFMPLSLSIIPVLVYFWFNYMVLKRIERLNISNVRFRNTAVKVFSFFFLKLFYVIVFIMQCVFTFNPVSSIH